MPKSVLGILIVLLWRQFFCIAQTNEKYPLKVGAAKVDITPSNMPLAPATGKYDHERIYVREIIHDNSATRAALISSDVKLDEPNWAILLEQLTAELNCLVEKP